MGNKLEEETILEILKKTLTKILKPDKKDITQDTRFIEDLEIDSLDRLEFGYAVEEKLQVKISDEKILDFNSINDYMKYLSEERNLYK